MTEPLQKAADASARASNTFVPNEPSWGRPLSARQRRFVEEYLLDCNAFAAARRAGYSEHTVQRLMARPEVARAIREAMDARGERLRIGAERVLLELARIAFSDIGRIIDWSGPGLTVEPPGRLSADDRAAISEVTVITGDGERGLAIKVKLHDKQRALELLARHLRLWGPHALQDFESPSAAADRIRALIVERVEKLRQTRDKENAEALGRI